MGSFLHWEPEEQLPTAISLTLYYATVFSCKYSKVCRVCMHKALLRVPSNGAEQVEHTQKRLLSEERSLFKQ